MDVGADEVAVGQKRPARPAGDSRRVDDDQAVLVGDVGRPEAGRRCQKSAETVELASRRLKIEVPLDGRQPAPGAVDHGLVFRVNEQGLRAAVIQVENDFLGRKPPIDGQDDGADGGGGPVEQKIVQAVFAQNTDPLALLHPLLPQPRRQPVHLLLDVSEAERALILDIEPGRAVAVTDRVAVDQVVKRVVVKCHGCTTLHPRQGAARKHLPPPTAG